MRIPIASWLVMAVPPCVPASCLPFTKNQIASFVTTLFDKKPFFLYQIVHQKNNTGLPHYRINPDLHFSLHPAKHQQPPIPQPPALTGAATFVLSGLAMAERETLTRTSWAISKVTTVSVKPVIVP